MAMLAVVANFAFVIDEVEGSLVLSSRFRLVTTKFLCEASKPVSVQPAVVERCNVDVEVPLPSRGDSFIHVIFIQKIFIINSQRDFQDVDMHTSNICGEVACSSDSMPSHSQRSGARELAAFDTRGPIAEIASSAAGGALEDMPIDAVGIEILVAAHQTWTVDTPTVGGGAVRLI